MMMKEQKPRRSHQENPQPAASKSAEERLEKAIQRRRLKLGVASLEDIANDQLSMTDNPKGVMK